MSNITKLFPWEVDFERPRLKSQLRTHIYSEVDGVIVHMLKYHRLLVQKSFAIKRFQFKVEAKQFKVEAKAKAKLFRYLLLPPGREEVASTVESPGALEAGGLVGTLLMFKLTVG